MVPEQRRRVLVQTVLAEDGATIRNLSERYGVSEMTIRRDLRQLAKEGRLQLTHGGAVPTTAQRGAEQLYALKEPVHRDAKVAIARYAAEHFVDDGDVIILDPGTTAVHMIPFLRDKGGLTVVTNGLATINVLEEALPQATLVCTGGLLRGPSQTFVGPTAEAFFDNFFAARYFVSSVGVTVGEGLTDPQPLDTQVKKAMLRSAKEVVALLDSSKFGIRSTYGVAPISHLAALITDQRADPAVTARFRDLVDVNTCEV